MMLHPSMAHSSVPNFQPGLAENDQDHDASGSEAMVAVNLISSARVILKLDNVYTEYSAQYIVDKACRKKEDRQDPNLTVKEAFQFAFEQGIPKDEDWPHLGSIVKPPSSWKPTLIPMKGEVVEANDLEGLYELLLQQPVGAKLHVFSPSIDLVGDGIYCGPCEGDHYVGLRDVIVVAVTKIGGIATVKICYKKKVSFIEVNLATMFLRAARNGDHPQVTTEPTALLVDFIVPRLSIN